MSSVIRVAAIGAGIALRDLHAPALGSLQDCFQVTTICSRTLSKADGIAGQIADLSGKMPEVTSDLDAVLDSPNVDAVLVAVPIAIQSGIVRRALNKRKHVLSEKPIAETIQEGQELTTLAKANNRVYLVGEQFRYRPSIRQLRNLVENGAIGDPLLYRLNMLNYLYPDGKYQLTPWRREGKHKGGYLIDGTTHYIAGMRTVVNSPAVSVSGLAGMFNPELLSQQDDTLLLHLQYANGMLGEIAIGYSFIDHEARHPKLYGRKGTAVLFENHIEIWPVDRNSPAQKIALESDSTGIREEWIDFYNGIVNNTPILGTPEEALADLQVILSGLESSRSGRVVMIEPLFT